MPDWAIEAAYGVWQPCLFVHQNKHSECKDTKCNCPCHREDDKKIE
jgi:hypothetical protein